jgi:hypothetical protein
MSRASPVPIFESKNSDGGRAALGLPPMGKKWSGCTKRTSARRRTSPFVKMNHNLAGHVSL